MSDILLRLTTPILVGLILTASALVIFNDWRLSLAALAVQYLLAAALVAQIVVVQVAVVKALVGLLVIGILAYTGREVNFGRVRGAAQDGPHLRPDECGHGAIDPAPRL